jgi:hypothetical protein
MECKYLHNNGQMKSYDLKDNYRHPIEQTTTNNNYNNNLNYYQQQTMGGYHQPCDNENHLKQYDKMKYQQHNCYYKFPNCNHYLNGLMNLCTKPHCNYWKNYLLIIILFTIFDILINLICNSIIFAVNASAVASSPVRYLHENYLSYSGNLGSFLRIFFF